MPSTVCPVASTQTVDGGAHWTLQFQNQNPDAFYDCFAFWTPKRGIAISDSVNGRFPDLRTSTDYARHIKCRCIFCLVRR